MKVDEGQLKKFKEQLEDLLKMKIEKVTYNEDTREMVVKFKRQRIQDIVLENGMKVEINHDSKSKCKCGAEIIWALTKNDKQMPVELVGLAKWDTHYATCPYANEFRKKKK